MKSERPSKPLIVDRKTKRFWVLVDRKDGAMWCSNVSSDIDHGSESHEEVEIYTSEAIAMRAAAAVQLNYDVAVTPVEVTITRLQ